MGDEQQASVTPAAEAAKTPAPEGDSQSEKGTETAERKQPEVTDEQKKLNDKLAQQGRDLKAAKDEAARLQTELAEARERGDKLWFTHPDTPEKDKDEFRKSREQANKDAPKLATMQNRIALSDAIADEENPTIRKALRSLRETADASKEYPSASFIAALRASLAPEKDEGTKTVEEAPPGNVSATRGTGAAGGPSLDEQIKVMETVVKSDRSRYGELLALRQRKFAEVRAAQG